MNPSKVEIIWWVAKLSNAGAYSGTETPPKIVAELFSHRGNVEFDNSPPPA
jgi:hypothetical protein